MVKPYTDCCFYWRTLSTNQIRAIQRLELVFEDEFAGFIALGMASPLFRFEGLRELKMVLSFSNGDICRKGAGKHGLVSQTKQSTRQELRKAMAFRRKKDSTSPYQKMKPEDLELVLLLSEPDYPRMDWVEDLKKDLNVFWEEMRGLIFQDKVDDSRKYSETGEGADDEVTDAQQ